MTPRLRALAGLALLAAGNLRAEPPDVLRWRRYAEPAFPLELVNTRMRDGFVSLVFTFDDSGRVTDRVALTASHPAFVGTVFEATNGWEVDTTGLSPFIRRQVLRFEFELRRTIVSMTQREVSKVILNPYGDQAATALSTYREEQLDVKPRVVASVAPTYPEALKTRDVLGFATVNFLIDAEGRVRVPAITDANEPEFGVAALAVIRQWRFTPPHRNGLPAQAIVERTFQFGSPKNASPETKPTP